MNNETPQITTLTFFKFGGFYGKIWAFFMMQFAHKGLKKTEGIEFYKLMGSGKGNGFNPWPDWSVYSLLQVWDCHASAKAFFNTAPIIEKYALKSTEVATFYMKNIKAHGQWSGQEPFTPILTIREDQPIAVITRATIKTTKLFRFWRYVPTAEKPIINNSNLLMTKGIGEVPLTQMATFSLWKNQLAMQQFAYKTKEHAKAVSMTRSLKWYKEELFARFQPYKMTGTWEGKSWEFNED